MLVLLIAVFFSNMYEKSKAVYFCGVNNNNKAENCAPCPLFGECNNGELKKCTGLKKVSDDKLRCVDDEEMDNTINITKIPIIDNETTDSLNTIWSFLFP